MCYIDKIRKQVKDYYDILCPDFPDWIGDYIETSAMLKQQYISLYCAKTYSKMFHYRDYSSLEHSIGVALIIWNFTHDKKQALSGLFHDIATPTFNHCVDFLNGDYMIQESTEKLTKKIIFESQDIMDLLKRDNIKIDEICDYHIYPIADNDTPMLSADRLEYSLSTYLMFFENPSLDFVRDIYNDIEIQKNENGIIELGFKTKKFAREFVKITSKLSISYRDDDTRFYMQVIADLLKKCSQDGLISKIDLYSLKDSDVVDIIKKSKYSNIYNKLVTIKRIKKSDEEPKGVYYVNHGAKVRYIDPLINGKRISSVCKIAKRMIEKNLSYDMNKYLYLDDSLNILK